MYDHILIRYGELALKGKNYARFLKKLFLNIKEIVKLTTGEIPKLSKERGRIFLHLNGESPEKYYDSLKKVFGVISFSPVRKTILDIEEIKKIALEEIKSLPNDFYTFKVISKRSNKSFPLKSPAIMQEVGAFLLKNTNNLKVDVHNPQVEVYVEIRQDAAYIYSQKIKGTGGLPLGTGGKALLLLSGGIDSPVAGWLTMKRGVVIEAIHFHSYPYTSERAKEKVLDLARKLSEFSGEINVHIVSFTRIQKEISENCFESLWITIMRRFMFRIAEKIAESRGALALVTGESIGQVASQTLDSMYAINHVINTPVIRPLITMDKEEIMERAKHIGTYDTSIQPYEDCCTVFLPKEPKTKPSLSSCLKSEKYLQVDELVEDALKNTEMITIKPQDEDEFDYFK